MNRSGPATVGDLVPVRETSVVSSTSRSTASCAAALYPAPAMLAFVRRQIAQAEIYNGPERRSEIRSLLAMPVVVHAVDEQIRPVADPQAMVIRDLCENGVGLVHEHPFDYKRIIIQMSYPAENTVLVAERLSTKTIGPFYHLSCRILGRFEGLDNFPHLRT